MTERERELSMKIKWVDIHSIRPYERNPRVNDSAVEAVARSIDEFGFRQPIVVDEQAVIVAGDTRLKAAVKLGLKKVPVLRAAFVECFQEY
jgi:ParB-like chromosome segregation protein Spo0J